MGINQQNIMLEPGKSYLLTYYAYPGIFETTTVMPTANGGLNYYDTTGTLKSIPEAPRLPLIKGQYIRKRLFFTMPAGDAPIACKVFFSVLKILEALALSEGICPWLEQGKEVLIVVPSQNDSVFLLGIWDKARARTSRSLMLLYPAADELVGLENTAGASWFDLSFDGRYVALVVNGTLALLDLDELETRIVDTIQPNTLSFLPDGRLIARAVGRRTTVITPDTGEIRVEQPGTYVIPTAQPLNTQVHALMHARDVEHRFKVIRKAPAIRLPQERYISMLKEDKIRFDEWIAAHIEE